MGKDSPIEWCDHTFNPWIGCSKVSPGCKNCYAETQMDHRWNKVQWGPGKPRKRTSASYWKQPLRWNAAADQGVCVDCGTPMRNDGVSIDCRCGQAGAIGMMRRPRVFCSSLADWLDPEVSVEWLADLLDLIRRTPHQDWLLLTKRPELWEERICKAHDHIFDNWSHYNDQPRGDACAWISNWGHGWKPANVWIGTSVEDQKRADERIPALLQIPAKVRFLSCEPLLGDVDLGLRSSTWDRGATWASRWVRLPRDVRGDWTHADKVAKSGVYRAHANCHGAMSVEATNGKQLFQLGIKPAEFECLGAIHWVIAGGESGPHARPMHPDWARSLRDQCAASDVPFFFKQWGEWLPGCQYQEGDRERLRERAQWTFDEDNTSWNVGKKAAGRSLDGVTHNEFPKALHSDPDNDRQGGSPGPATAPAGATPLRSNRSGGLEGSSR